MVYRLASLVKLFAHFIQSLHKGDIVFKFCASGHQLQLFLLKTDHFLPLIVLFIALHILNPEVLRALHQHLVNVLLFLVDQIQFQLLFHL